MRDYRDFYRDIGFDLDFDYVKPHLPAPDQRGFTGIKYYRITGDAPEKQIYDRDAALQAAAEHAQTFSRSAHGADPASRRHHGPSAARASRPTTRNCSAIGGMKGRSFWITSCAKRITTRKCFRSSRPHEYLSRHPTQQVATAQRVQLGRGRLLARLAQRNERMDLSAPARRAGAHDRTRAQASRRRRGLQQRALKQAARELLLAQSSDWPFILRTGTSPDYARKRVKDHLLRFIALHEQLTTTSVDEQWLARIEAHGQYFPGY